MTDELLSGGSGEFILYQAEDGTTRLQVRVENETVWLSQRDMAELFQTTPQNITLHVAAIYGEGELVEAATCKEYLQVRAEGARQVRRSVRHYNLDVIISVGYRVKSLRGTQFRIWPTQRRSFMRPCRCRQTQDGIDEFGHWIAPKGRCRRREELPDRRRTARKETCEDETVSPAEAEGLIQNKSVS